MNNLLDAIFSLDFLFTTLRVMTPILFAAMACMVFLKGGVDPIGTEGIMLLCSLGGVLGGYYSSSYIIGITAAMIVGAMSACLYVYATTKMGCDKILAGVALNMLASGLTVFIVYYVTGEKGSTQSLASPVAPSVNIPFIKDIPILGSVLSGHNLLTYLGLILIIVLFYIIYKTPLGLRIRSVGENALAAKSLGISIAKYRYITAIIAGSLAGIGGAFMSMGYVSNFSREMIAGRGFIGMAAEGMGRGTPLGILLSSMLFGAADALSIRMQMLDIPARVIQAFPYIVTIVAISIYSYIATTQKSKRQN